MSFQCIWCGQRIDVDRGSWAYMRSVALLHLSSCDARPAGLTRDGIDEMATQIADKIEKSGRT